MADKWEWLLIGLAIGVPIGIVIVSILTRPPIVSVPEAMPVRTYNNNESWEFIRDERGLVVGATARRHAEQT